MPYLLHATTRSASLPRNAMVCIYSVDIFQMDCLHSTGSSPDRTESLEARIRQGCTLADLTMLVDRPPRLEARHTPRHTIPCKGGAQGVERVVGPVESA